MAIQAEVIVVGGGPTGLVLAILLARFGVQTMLVDQRHGPTDHPKATALNVRTMEILRTLGLDTIVRTHAPPGNPSAIHWMTRLAGYELGTLEILTDAAELTNYSPVTAASCPQDRLEEHLLETASLPSLDLRLAMRFENLKAADSGVTGSIRGRNRRAASVSARFLVAADGAASYVRHALGINRHGPPAAGHRASVCFSADLRPWTEQRPTLATWVCNSDVQGVLVPLDSDRWLLTIPVQEDASGYPITPSRRQAMEHVRAAVGDEALNVQVRSISTWSLCALVAERFHCSSVFLVGDAAHQFPPSGSYGLNSGIQDSHNIAWKLAAVLRHWAGPDLLATYDTERRPVALANQEQSVRNLDRAEAVTIPRHDTTRLRALEHPGPKGESARATFAKAVPKQTERFRSDGQALGYRYGASGDSRSRTHESISDYHPSASVGSRAPHVWFSHKGSLVSSIDLFDQRPVLLLGPAATTLEDRADAFARTHDHIPLDIVRIGREGSHTDYIDAEGRWLTTYALDENSGVLVRPDGHVA